MNFKSTMAVISLLAMAGTSGAEAPQFGAGEMEKPARTFYVSTKGNDANDGKTLETAWRTIEYGVKALRAGDTLQIDEGEYRTHEAKLNVKDKSVGFAEQCGKPGSPIRIAGMPGKKVMLCGADFLPNPAVPVRGKVYQFKLKKKPNYNTIMESPSGIRLQQVFNPAIALEYPGTYYLDDNGKLLVHYAAEGQNGIRVARDRIALRIHGSYILVENLTFKYYCEAIYTRMNMPYDKNAAEHITIRDCKFFHNYKNGIVIDGASFSLVTKNIGMQNGEYGTVMVMARGHDNLYTGNWFGPSPETLRQLTPYVHNYALNQYGDGKTSVRNYVIGNVLEDKLSFRWKQQATDARFEDNMCYGSYYTESSVRPIIIARNWFGNKVAQKGIGWDLWDKNFKGTPIVFKDNVRDKKDFKPENQIVFEAEKLRMEPEKVIFPDVTFTDVQVKFIEHDGAAICWTTPECDGLGSIAYREKSETKDKRLWTTRQGVRHELGVTGLKPDTEYEYRLIFSGRRGGQWKRSGVYRFRTAKVAREPKTLEVGPGKLTLNEAALAAMPGDTVKVLSGTHTGQFIPSRSGTADKPITLKGEPGAVIDGQLFYNPLIRLDYKKHIMIDGLSFIRPESTMRSGIIIFEHASDITVRNCRADYLWTAGPMIRGRRCSNIQFVNNISNGGDYPVALSGKNITVSNNTIVNATMWSTSFWENSDLTVTNNIFCRPCQWNKRNTALAFYAIRGKIVSDGNVFWSPVKEHPVGGTIHNFAGKVLKQGRTLKEWQQVSGMDQNSIHADPMFMDYKNGDFRLKEGSPAKGKGATLP